MDVRILVVEDDSKIASFVAGGLRQHGFAVDSAGDGDEALALVASTAYDAAVVDVMLPRLDGLSLVRRLRAGRNALPVELQPREFTLLAFLLRHAGRPVTKTMILEHVWDYSFDPQTNVVDVLVHRLRAKVDPDHRRIETVRGVGYVLKA